MDNKTCRTITDILMFGTMCFLAGTGLLFQYRLVPGFMGGRGLTVLGLSRHEWGTYHLWAAYLLLFLVLVHMALNYAFIKNCIAAKRTWVVAVLGLLGAAIISAFLLLPVKRGAGDGQEQGHGMRLRGGQGNQGQGKVTD
jgi:hypothetical protein